MTASRQEATRQTQKQITVTGSGKTATLNSSSLTFGTESYITAGTGINANSHKITNVADGTVNATSTDAVNGSQLYGYTTVTALDKDGNTIAANLTGANGVKIKAGDNISLSASGDTLTIKSLGGTDTQAVHYDYDPKAHTGSNSITLIDKNGRTAATGGDSVKITNLAAGDITATSTDAVNGSQIYPALKTVTFDSSNGQFKTTTLGNSAEQVVATIHDYALQSVAAREVTGTSGNKSTFLDFTIADKYGTATQTKSVDMTNYLNKTTIQGVTGNIIEGKNIKFTPDGTGTNVSVDLYDDVNLGSVTAGDVTGAELNNRAKMSYDAAGAYIQVTNNATGTAAANDTATLKATGLTVTDGTRTTTVGATALTVGNETYITAGTGINANSHKITSVADGDITSTSTDAINGSQLYAVKEMANITDAHNYYNGTTTPVSAKEAINAVDAAVGKWTAGAGSNLVNYDATSKTTSAATSVGANLMKLDAAIGSRSGYTGGTLTDGQSVTDSLKALDTALAGAKSAIATGYTFSDGTNEDSVALGKTLTVKGAKATPSSTQNITTAFTKGTDGNASIEIALNDDLVLNSVTATGAIQGDTITGATSVTAGTGANQVVLNNNGVNVGGNTYITGSGINANSNKITGVAAGTTATDAVNYGQISGAYIAATYVGDKLTLTKIDGTTTQLTITGGGSNIADYTGTGNNELTFKDRTGSTTSGKIVLKNVEIEGIASGTKAEVDDKDAFAIGMGAIASGYNSNAAGEKSVANGYGATAEAASSIAVGNMSAVSKKSTSGIAIGDGTTVGYKEGIIGGEDMAAKTSIGIGYNSTVTGVSSIAIGSGHYVSGNNSGAFGDPNVVSGSGSYAIGNNNTIAGDNNFVLGNEVKITDKNITNSVALGNKSEVTESNVVSVGNASEGGQRRIVNVAPGVNATDAATYGQLTSLADTVVKQQAQITETAKETREVGAMSAALAGLHYMEPSGDEGDKFTGAVSYGGYRGENAAAVGIAYKPSPNLMVSASTSVSNNQNMYNAGVGFKFGKGSTAATRAGLQKQVKYLNDRNSELSSRLDSANTKIEQQGKENAQLQGTVRQLMEKVAELADKVQSLGAKKPAVEKKTKPLQQPAQPKPIQKRNASVNTETIANIEANNAVQIAASPNKTACEGIAAKARKAGFDTARVIEAQKDGSTIYRVQVFTDGNAQTLAQQLKAKGFNGFAVKR